MKEITALQRRVWALAAEGCSNREIATEIEAPEYTVKNVLHSLFDKFGVWNRVELANRYAHATGHAPEAALTKIESHRREAVLALEILDTAAERVFDNLAELVRITCRTPIAVISIVDATRVWLKSKPGLDFPEVDRSISLCHHSIQQSGPFIVGDTLRDQRLIGNSLVTDAPRIRFYAGEPLIDDEGYGIGMLCAIDVVPRRLNRSQLASLKSLARVTIEQLEVRKKLIAFRHATAPSTLESAAPPRAA